MDTRQLDAPELRPPFRAPDRLFSVGSQWFFTAREGDNGPYETREYAEAALAHFLLQRLQTHPRWASWDS